MVQVEYVPKFGSAEMYIKPEASSLAIQIQNILPLCIAASKFKWPGNFSRDPSDFFSLGHGKLEPHIPRPQPNLKTSLPFTFLHTVLERRNRHRQRRSIQRELFQPSTSGLRIHSETNVQSRTAEYANDGYII
jgi:hypothetical protein